MNEPTTKALINGNYNVEKRRGDESPSFIRSAHSSVFFSDVELQPTSEKPLYRKTGLSKREKLMIAGIIFLVVLCIIFIALFAKAATKRKERQNEKLENESKEWVFAASGK